MNREQVYRWWRLFHYDNSPVEIRILGGRWNLSGYYKDIERLIADVEPHDNTIDEQIYFVINAIDDACYSRDQHERLLSKPKGTTSDNDITERRWVLIDLDPKRKSGVSSTDAELEKAHLKAVYVYRYLRSNGFNEPVVAKSGNGYHLLYPCQIPVSEESDNIIKRFLLTLSMLFSDQFVDIDEKVFNRARICKLYGTIAKKGSNTPERPHRLSTIEKTPDEVIPISIDYFKKIADLYPEDRPTPSRDNGWGRDKFDIHDFLRRHNIAYLEQAVAGGRKFILDHCAFNPEHKGKDAVIFQRDNGALSYVCLHNSCSHYKWRDFRLLFEPDAYDKRDYHEFQSKRRYYEPIQPQSPVSAEKTDKGKKWLSMSDIQWVDVESLVSIPTGYFELDRRILGLLLGDVTIISGLSGAGKTSWIDSICLNAVQKGFKVGVWSGELQDYRFRGWIMQIAAGKNDVVKKVGSDNYFYAPRKVSDVISRWLEGKMFLYNNQYGNRWTVLFDDIRELVETQGVQLVVLDNLMALNLDAYEGDKYARQTLFINALKDYAKMTNIHIILVCHPRKELGFLRKESISGTADLTNLCDNLFLIHRVGKDFETRASEFLGKKKVAAMMDNQYDSVVEVGKNRALGIVDFFTGMYYEPESRRLKNTVSENIIYGWDTRSVSELYDSQIWELPIEQTDNYNNAPF